MQRFRYLKRKKVTPQEIYEALKILEEYSRRFSKHPFELPLFPGIKDKFEINLSLAREKIAKQVIEMIILEFDIKKKSFSNPKFLIKVFKGELYVIANNIYTLNRSYYLTYKFLYRECKRIEEHKDRFMNLYSKEVNDELINYCVLQVIATNEILQILFDEIGCYSNELFYIELDYYDEEVITKDYEYIERLKRNPLWPKVRINYDEIYGKIDNSIKEDN